MRRRMQEGGAPQRRADDIVLWLLANGRRELLPRRSRQFREMPNGVRGGRSRAGVIRRQQVGEPHISVWPSAVGQHPSRIGRERAGARSGDELERGGLLVTCPISELSQRFRRMQSIGPTTIVKGGEDFCDPWLAFAIAARRLRQDA